MADLTAQQVRKLLRYDPDTGELFWLPRPREMFRAWGDYKAWNARYANVQAFTSDCGKGYYIGSIHDRKYKAHRVIWLMQTGEWPTDEIDHINGIRGDNRWANLRVVSRAKNCRNMGLRPQNTSGVTGVRWSERDQKWRARIKVDGITKSLGHFDTIEAAAEARAAANIAYGYSPRHGTAA